MSVTKNFVVRYGLEVDSNLIFADHTINKVGIGTTRPTDTLHVVGGIAATDINISGFGTIPVLSGDDLFYDRGTIIDGSIVDLTGVYLNYTGLGTITTLRGFRLSYDEAYVNVGIVTNIGGSYLNYTGLGTITNLIGQNLDYQNAYINAGIVTNIGGSYLNYTGLGTITNLRGQNLDYQNAYINTGIVTNISGTNLNYSGLGTITNLRSENAYINTGIVTNISGTNLNYSGIATLSGVKIHSGIVTSPSPSGIVTYYGDGTYLNLKKNPSTGVGLGVSAGVLGYGVTFINFYGSNILESIYDANVGIATLVIGNLENETGVTAFSLVKKLDDISELFDNTTTTFPISLNNQPYSPINSEQVLISLGGVIQTPDIDYTISSSNIIFTSPPEDGLRCLGLVLNDFNQKLINKIDDVSSSFDGTTTSFPLRVGGISTFPISEHQTLISVGGVVQNPNEDYSISGSNIIFNTSPSAGLNFSAISLDGLVGITSAARIVRGIDNIKHLFNNTRRAFPLSINFIPISPLNSSQILISLGGVIQDPGVDYVIAESSIIFSVPPSPELEFFGTIVGSTSGELPLDSLTVTGVAVLNEVFANTLSLSENNALSIGNIEISSGIITATSGILTYYGDGTYLDLTNNPSIMSGFSSNTTAISVSTTPPSSPVNGSLWYNPTYGRTFVWYDESSIGAGIGSAWVDASPYDSLGDEININTAGIITASGFVGDGSGLINVSGVSTNININTLGIITASSFVGDGSGLINVSGVATNININTLGIITASSYIGNNINISGIITASDFNSTSDVNLKCNIETVNNPITIVNSLRGVKFEWKENGKKSYGVIAQELEDVLPELVSTNEIKTVNYNGLIGVLIEVVKEQQQQIYLLKNEVDDLKNSISKIV